jgi:hypothetical protein
MFFDFINRPLRGILAKLDFLEDRRIPSLRNGAVFHLVIAPMEKFDFV